MYSRWAEARGFSCRVVERSEGDEAGIKSGTLDIEGRYAYGYLAGEKGTHRLVRISPFGGGKALRQVSRAYSKPVLLRRTGMTWQGQVGRTFVDGCCAGQDEAFLMRDHLLTNNASRGDFKRNCFVLPRKSSDSLFKCRQ